VSQILVEDMKVSVETDLLNELKEICAETVEWKEEVRIFFLFFHFSCHLG